MTISLRLNETDAQLIKAFANYKNLSVSAYIRTLVMDDIEAEYMRVLEKYLDMPEIWPD